MKRTVSWIVGVPAALIIIVVAVANREWVTFSLDPFSTTAPWFSVSLPLYALLLASIVLGMLIGGASAWFAQGKWRKAARRAEAEVRTLKTGQGSGHGPGRHAGEASGHTLTSRD